VFNLFLDLDLSKTTVQLSLSAGRIPMSLLTLKDFTVFNTFVVKLGVEDLDFSNMNLIFHMNSMLRVCGRFETTDSIAHAISRLGCG
jgi:hypothetical protein